MEENYLYLTDGRNFIEESNTAAGFIMFNFFLSLFCSFKKILINQVAPLNPVIIR